MSIKTEYITSNGFRFPEEQKEIAQQLEWYIDFLKGLKSLEFFIRDCVESAVPDNSSKDGLKKNEVYVMFSLLNSELSKMEH